MKIFRSIKKIKKHLASAGEGRTIGFVPTMGALHEGHVSLIKRSVKENDITVVSIFVNPAQFGPKEDYRRYPRQLKRDIELASAEGAGIFFVPEVDEIYPENYGTYVEVMGLDKNLCGPFRPGHFRGVATIVAKLLNIIRPDRAYFGKKDYQQLKIIERLVSDLNMGIKVVACETIRADSGVALSSRNAYLSESNRQNASSIYRALKKIKFMVKYRNLRSPYKAYKLFRSELNSEFKNAVIEYFQIVDSETLELKKVLKGTVVAACAVRIGRTRLIDNIVIRAQLL